jgi:undecaprenyl-diphosphatase
MLPEILKAAIMGAVQAVLGLEEVGITMEVVTHLATALAVIVFLRRRIFQIIAAVAGRLASRGRWAEAPSMDFRLFLFVIVGSLPAGVFGILLRDQIEGLFKDITSTGLMLILTGVFVFLTGRFARGSGPVTAGRSFVVGLAQAVAIIPGISRSGLTVGAGLALGIDRKAAFEFSLLLSLPAILGASAIELAGGRLGGDPIVILAAAVPAFVGGLFAIKLLFRTIIHHKFHAFAYYLIPVGILVLFL